MQLSPHADSAEAKAALDWQPRFATCEQGIDDMLLTWRAAAGAQPSLPSPLRSKAN